MATQTTNYKMTKPAGSERFDVTTWNTNMDTIDTAIKGVDNSVTTNVERINGLISQINELINQINDEISNLNDNNSNLNDDIGKLETDVNTLKDNVSTITSDMSGKVSKNGDTMTGVLKAHPNTNHTTAQVRNITLSTSEPTASDIEEGAIWAVYE